MSLTARPWRERLFGRKLLDLSFRLLSEVFGSERFIELGRGSRFLKLNQGRNRVQL